MRIAVILFYFLAGATAQAETIAIIGTGHVGGALGPEFAAQGHTIIYGSRNAARSDVADLVLRTGHGASAASQAEAAAQADIVVLAVPGMLVEEITRGLGDLSGKIIIDPTNPLNFAHSRVRHGAKTSNAEIIQQAAPGAHVVKAFNTLSWQYMIDPESSGGVVTIPLVGDNDEAKTIVASLVKSIDLHPIDVGPLEYARWIEGMAILLVNNNISSLPAFNFSLREVN